MNTIVPRATGVHHVRLGRTALLTSRLWLNMAKLGGRVADGDALRLMDQARERGINCVVAADPDGHAGSGGHTETRVGRWLAQGGGRRDDTVLVTGVGGERAGHRGWSARHLVAACEDALRRLGVTHVDLYQLHHVDRAVPWDEVWQAVEALVSSGKIRYVGASDIAGWQVVTAQENATRRHSLGLVSHQCRYNLAVRHAELEVLPVAQAYGLGVLARSPLHGGLLGGDPAQPAAGPVPPALCRAIGRYTQFCRDLGAHPAEVGLGWVLSRPGVTGAVIGPRTPEQLDSALRASGMVLGQPESSALDEIFPAVASGGAAPEAWLQ